MGENIRLLNWLHYINNVIIVGLLGQQSGPG